MKRNLLTIVFLSFIGFLANAQEFKGKLTDANKQSVELEGVVKCYTTESEELLQAKFPDRATIQQFEDWMQVEVEKYKRENLNTSGRRAVRTIPVVFHILSDGSGVDNVSTALINAQIDQLNLDFRNLTGSTIAVSADTEIEFCAAKQSPIGQNLPEQGINRIYDYGDGPFERSEFQSTIKPLTQWDPTQYLNVWVGPLTGTLLGYAQFPEAASLAGIGTGNGAATTDGVVITSFTVGSKANPNPASGTYGTGLTLTHEIGHWLGLRHIWGDGPCGFDDFCSDTPESDASNFGCTPTNSCGSPDQIQNFMDYTSDACKNTFTGDQSARMNVVLDSSPRRMELVTTSEACELSPVYDTDVAIQLIDINNPECTTDVAPIIKLTNLGNNAVTNVTIQYSIGFGNDQIINWTGNLASNQSEEITLPTQTLSGGFHTFSVSTSGPNNLTDEGTDNNSVFQLFNINAYDTDTIDLTLTPDNLGSQITWEFKNASGTVIQSGGPYTNGNTQTINESLQVPTEGCYTFTILDSNNDGICCEFGNGSYSLATPTGTTIANGADYGGIDETKVILGRALSVSDYFLNNTLRLYPNPTTNAMQIDVANQSELPDNYTIYNTLGQKIVNKTINNTSDLNVNTSSFNDGIYFIRIAKGQNFKVLSFVKK